MFQRHNMPPFEFSALSLKQKAFLIASEELEQKRCDNPINYIKKLLESTIKAIANRKG